MNRAILVVICDFVVLSMLSLTSINPGGGMPLAESSGGGGASSHGYAILDNSTSRTILERMTARLAELEEHRDRLIAASRTENPDPEVARQLDEVTRELAGLRVQTAYLEHRLELTPAELAEMTPEQLQKLLDAEAHSREIAQVRLDQVSSDLAYFRDTYKDTLSELRAASELLAATRTELDRTTQDLAGARQDIETKDARGNELDQALRQTREELAAAAAELTGRQAELATARAELTGARGELSATRDSLASTRSELSGVREQLTGTRSELSAAAARLEQSRDELAHARGQLEQTEMALENSEHELAEARARLEAERRNAQSRELELGELRGDLAKTQRLLNDTVGQLQSARNELKNRSTEAEAAATTLTQLREQVEIANAKLLQAEEMLSSDVMQKYQEAVSRLDLHLRESRMILDFRLDRQLFLPEIILDGRRYLVGEVRSATGFDKGEYSDSLTELSYASASPLAEGAPQSPVTVLRLPSADRRVALFPAPGTAAAALRPIAFPDLLKRGLQDLYLFKYRSFGTESGPLDGRVSPVMEQDSNYIYIRNSLRGSELRAEPGDFVLTRQGDFVGVVVARENIEAGSKEEAKVFVFPARPVFDAEVVEVDLAARDAEGRFAEFARSMRNLTGELQQLDTQKRR